MLGLLIALLMNLGLICSVDDFNSRSTHEQMDLQEIVIVDTDLV